MVADMSAYADISALDSLSKASIARKDLYKWMTNQGFIV